MMIVTTESIHEERYQVLGLVRGCSAYSKAVKPTLSNTVAALSVRR